MPSECQTFWLNTEPRCENLYYIYLNQTRNTLKYCFKQENSPNAKARLSHPVSTTPGTLRSNNERVPKASARTRHTHCRANRKHERWKADAANRYCNRPWCQPWKLRL